MITIKEILIDHLEYTFAKEAWQPPLGSAVRGLTAEQAAWKPFPERHSIWQIVRHVIRWKRGALKAWAGDPPDYEQMTREDWQEATGDQSAWEADVRALNEIYSDFRQRLEALDDEGLGSPQRRYQQQKQPQPVAVLLMRTFTHDIYHAGQIQYLRALQGIPLDRLATAAWDGDVARLGEVLDVYPDLLNAYNREGWTALQIASYSGQAEAVRFLLTRGADIHLPSQSERAATALHLAVTGWQVGMRAHIVALLLDRGADPEATDSRGNTVLHLAAQEGARETVELLLRRGANVNARRKDRATPLGAALKDGQTAVSDRCEVSAGSSRQKMCICPGRLALRNKSGSG